jgi:hypothetical protein
VVLDLMIHDLDLVLSIVQSEIESIEAVGVPVLTDRFDIANARLRFSSGCVANITASRISRDRTRKIRFFQRDAYISIDTGAKEADVYRLVRHHWPPARDRRRKIPCPRANRFATNRLVDAVRSAPAASAVGRLPRRRWRRDHGTDGGMHWIQAFIDDLDRRGWLNVAEPVSPTSRWRLSSTWRASRQGVRRCSSNSRPVACRSRRTCSGRSTACASRWASRRWTIRHDRKLMTPPKPTASSMKLLPMVAVETSCPGQ